MRKRKLTGGNGKWEEGGRREGRGGEVDAGRRVGRRKGRKGREGEVEGDGEEVCRKMRHEKVWQGVFSEIFVSNMSGLDVFVFFCLFLWRGTNAPREHKCAWVKMSPHDRCEGTVTVKTPGPKVVSPQQTKMAFKVSAKLSLLLALSFSKYG